MKFLLGIAAIALVMVSACGNSVSSESKVTESAHAYHHSDTPEKFEDSLKECFISKHLDSYRVEFDVIKAQCFETELAKCEGDAACETQFRAATQELMTHATGVDCDSGYCSVLY